MKILQIGSKSIHVSNYLENFDSSKDDVYLLTEEKCNFLEHKKEFEVNFRSLNPISLVKNYFKLKKIIKSLKPDVIHIHQINRLAYFVSNIASKLNIHLVSTAWGSDVLLIPKQNKFFYFLVKKTLQRSNFVTADSQNMIYEMMKIVVSSSKYHLLQYGINPVEKGEKENLIFSNRLHKSLYRVNQIVNYFLEFSAKNPDWKLIIGATGNETENLKNQVENLGLNDKVVFVGWLKPEENKIWYSKSKIYISIPESDGTSVSVLEAMSAACIPVLSDLPSNKEWVKNCANGIIEQEGLNPLIEALNLDFKKCEEINRSLIIQKATKQASFMKFKKLYNSKND